MLKLKKIAITGSLSCGKSSACHFFKELGSYTISADEIVHQLLSSHVKLTQQIVDLLGSDILENNQIERSRIAKKVFNNPQLLQSLENILHPLVYEEIELQYKRANQERNTPLFVVEIPLLYETNGSQWFDKTILVTADPQTCKKRYLEKNNGHSEDYEKRLARFIHLDEKILKADYIIQNDGTLNQMKEKVKEIYDDLLEK